MPPAAPTPEPTAEPTAEPTPEVTPEPTPVAIEFSGEGSKTTPEFVLPAATYEVALSADPIEGAVSCSIVVALVPQPPTTGADIEVGHVESESQPIVIPVDVPAGTYALEIVDPGCAWTVSVTGG